MNKVTKENQLLKTQSHVEWVVFADQILMATSISAARLSILVADSPPIF